MVCYVIHRDGVDLFQAEQNLQTAIREIRHIVLPPLQGVELEEV